MKLTAATVRSAAIPPGKSEAIYFDDDVPGLWYRGQHERRLAPVCPVRSDNCGDLRGRDHGRYVDRALRAPDFC